MSKRSPAAETPGPDEAVRAELEPIFPDELNGSPIHSREKLLETTLQNQEAQREELAVRVRTAHGRTDGNIDDDPAGIARKQLAAASEQRHKDQDQALAQINAQQQRLLRSTEARTDNDISDDAAGLARKALADASQKRREEEAQALAEANAATARQRNTTGTRTDDDINDEAAGRARKQLAEASRRRREDEIEELARRNAYLIDIRSNAGPRTDSSLDDEAAGRARKELAEASRKRREVEAERIQQANNALQNRLNTIKSKTDDGDGGGLYESTGVGLLQRDTDVPRASFLRFAVEQENKEIAKQLREQRLQLRQIRIEQERQWLDEGRAASADRQKRQKRLRKLQKEVHKNNRSLVRDLRDDLARREQEKEAKTTTFREAARIRVLEASALDARLDAAEEEQDARERKEGTRVRLAVAAAFTRTRAEILAEKRQLVEEVQAARVLPLSARATHFTPERGQTKRDEAKIWAQQRDANEAEYLANAHANRAKAEAQRRFTQKSMMALLKQRKKNVKHERANDHAVKDEKARILAANRREVAAIYSKRFASKEQVASMWSSAGGLIAPPRDVATV